MELLPIPTNLDNEIRNVVIRELGMFRQLIHCGVNLSDVDLNFEIGSRDVEKRHHRSNEGLMAALSRYVSR